MNGDPHKEYDFGFELDDIKADDWTPHAPGNDQVEKKPNLDQVRKIAEKEGFTSREPKAAPKKEPEGQITIRGKLRSSLSGGRISRILFCGHKGVMVLLHGFIKKAQKTPKPDLDLALDRMKKVKSNGK